MYSVFMKASSRVSLMFPTINEIFGDDVYLLLDIQFPVSPACREDLHQSLVRLPGLVNTSDRINFFRQTFPY